MFTEIFNPFVRIQPAAYDVNLTIVEDKFEVLSMPGNTGVFQTETGVNRQVSHTKNSPVYTRPTSLLWIFRTRAFWRFAPLTLNPNHSPPEVCLDSVLFSPS
jgi:hypothetical protein